MLFLVVACIVTLVKLLGVCHKALPFRLSRQAENAPYLNDLRFLAASLNHWSAFTYLGLGIHVGLKIYDGFGRNLSEKLLGTQAALATVQQSTGAFPMALVVNLFAFLVRW